MEKGTLICTYTHGPPVVIPLTHGPPVVIPLTHGPPVVISLTHGPPVVLPLTHGPPVVLPLTHGPPVVIPLSLSVVSQEVLQERLRKHGVDSPFGHFLKNETSRMATCLQKIHSNLQVNLSHHSKIYK